jgi:integrase/recombinase XerC
MEEHIFDHLNEEISGSDNGSFAQLSGVHLDTESLIQGYILNCRCEGKSPKTISFYQGNLKRFLWYCREYNFPTNPADLMPLHFRQFLWYISSEDVRWGSRSSRSIRPAKKAVAHYYHCLHIFFEWLTREGIIALNPLNRINKPKNEKRYIQALTTEEIKTLLNNCPAKSVTGYRNRTILMMLIDSGMRVSELASLRLSDVEINSGSILIRNGKGNKQRTVRIGAVVQKSLWRYLTLFRKGNKDNLFLTSTGQPLEADAIKLLIRRLGKRAGISGVHVHRLRHTFAISFLRAGGDIFSLKYLLGHNSLTMVENYLRSLDAEDAARAHQRYSPLDNMKP